MDSTTSTELEPAQTEPGPPPHLMADIPLAVRELAGSWPSLIGRVRHLTAELEKDFRFGRTVVKIGGHYRIGGNIKGGTSSMWYPSSRQDYKAYLRWHRLEGIRSRRNRKAFRALLTLCTANGIRVLGSRRDVEGERVGAEQCHLGPVFALILDVLKVLPPHHLSRPEFSALQIGGWGPDGAKASAYKDGTVMMYDFSLVGARRTFFGLLLHELGHAAEHALEPGRRVAVEEPYRTICAENAFLGVEYLLDAGTRVLLQSFALNEFLAETYMIYVSQGQRLRSYIERLSSGVREAWQQVYGIMRSEFGNREYL